MIYHFGRWHGFNAAFARLTDERVTIIILGNKYNSNIYRVANKAYDIFGNYDQKYDKEEGDTESDDLLGSPGKSTAIVKHTAKK